MNELGSGIGLEGVLNTVWVKQIVPLSAQATAAGPEKPLRPRIVQDVSTSRPAACCTPIPIFTWTATYPQYPPASGYEL